MTMRRTRNINSLLFRIDRDTIIAAMAPYAITKNESADGGAYHPVPALTDVRSSAVPAVAFGRRNCDATHRTR